MTLVNTDGGGYLMLENGWRGGRNVFIRIERHFRSIGKQTTSSPLSEVAADGRGGVMLVSGSSISKDWEVIIVALPIPVPL